MVAAPERSRLTPAKDLLRTRWSWVALGITVLLIFSIRVRLREMPLERDEGEYAYAGQLLLQAVPPYTEAYNMKLPGTYMAYAITMGIFGQTPAGIHFGLALINAASIVLMFLVARRVLNEAGAVATAVAFALLSTSPSVLGLAAHATHFVVFFALAGMWSLLQPGKIGKGLSAALAGVFFGLAFIMKQHGIFFGAFGGAFLLWEQIEPWLMAQKKAPRYRRARTNEIQPRRKFPLALLSFAGGFVTPYVLTCLWLLAAGAFNPFIFWTVSYAAKYASSLPVMAGPELLKAGVRAVVGPNIVLWILPWIGAVVIWWDRRLDPGKRFFLLALMVFSVIAASVGFYFREHYFILLLPAMSLLTGAVFSRGLYLLKHDKTIELFLAVPLVGLFVIAVGAALVGNGPVWFGLSPEAAVRRIYGTNLYSEASRAAQFLKEHSDAKDRVAILGSEPEIYFYAHRRSATGYIYMYPLTEAQRYAPKMQQELIEQIESRHPEYVVYVSDKLSWLPGPGTSNRLQSWWDDYWVTRLDLVATFQFEERAEAESLQAMEGTVKSTEGETCRLLVFRRKQN